MNNRFILIVVFFLAVGIGFFHYHMKKRPEKSEWEPISRIINQTRMWQGKTAPDFEGELLSGGKFTLSDYIGKRVIILNFFATWCGPCREEMPELERFYAKHRKEKLILVGIAEESEKEAVSKFVQNYKLTFPVIIDEKGKIGRKYGVTSYPTTVMIGAQGSILLYEIGMISNTEATFDKLYRLNVDLLKKGKGISKKLYLEKRKLQEKGTKGKAGEKKLEGRAGEIADKMGCLCGCERELQECTCTIARKMKRKLETMDMGEQTDTEIIRKLHKEFCPDGK